MTTLNDLKTVVKDTLENRGVLAQIRARLRAEVYNALDDYAEPKPELSNENLLINELILEYLEFNQYRYAASVLVAESKQPLKRLDHAFLADQMNVVENDQSKKIPLLYSLVNHYVGSSPENQQNRDVPADPRPTDPVGMSAHKSLANKALPSSHSHESGQDAITASKMGSGPVLIESHKSVPNTVHKTPSAQGVSGPGSSVYATAGNEWNSPSKSSNDHFDGGPNSEHAFRGQAKHEHSGQHRDDRTKEGVKKNPGRANPSQRSHHTSSEELSNELMRAPEDSN